ncbi:hypothetical protein ACS0TY_004762 [Phlomoides rotata]
MANPRPAPIDASKLTRDDFPSDFLFGGSTSAFQIEGAFQESGKSHSNWDVWTLEKPGKIADGKNGCVAIDHYYQFKEDVKLLKKLGIDCYRFSISWSRILPGGRLSTGVNRDGVKFYNDLIDLLLAEGITPMVTIFHFELPQSVQEYGGFLEKKLIVKDFAEYAEVCFFEFGDRVKHWITMNEPWTFTSGGYIQGTFPPGRGSTATHKKSTETNFLSFRACPGVDLTLTGGNCATEPYIVAHHLLLAHATAVDIYRRKYQAVQGGIIGITNMSGWYVPFSDTQADKEAALRAVDFQWGWFTAPVVNGDYPASMRERVGSRLPTFTPEEEILVKGSFDFIGMNYYTTYYAKNDPTKHLGEPTYLTDQGLTTTAIGPDNKPIGEQAASEWLYIVPSGIQGLLNHNATTYGNPNVYITENGVDEKNDRIPISEAIKDEIRIKFHQDHLFFMKKAIEEDHVKLKGYMLWSLFDNFEWSEGYTVRFGMYYVDYVNGLIRYPKNSAIWYMNFLNKNPKLPSIKRQVVEEADAAAVKRKSTRNGFLS